jgi:hypothetical protein
MRELEVRMILAYSPQARGRSERSFSTWQGRLPQRYKSGAWTDYGHKVSDVARSVPMTLC